LHTRVVYIVSDLYYSLAFEWLVKNLNRSKIDLHFILIQNHQNTTALETLLQQENIPVYRLIAPQGKRGALAGAKLFFILRKLKPGAIHCHMRRANVLGLIAGRMANVPHRIFTRHYSTQNHQYYPKGVKTDRLLNKLATCIVAPSETVRNTLVDVEKVSPLKVKIIYHGFDLDYFAKPDSDKVRAIRLNLKLNEKGPVVGVISRFLELKGLQFIIPAFTEFHRNFPDAVLLLANAHGPYEPQVDRLLSQLPATAWRKVRFEQNLAALYGCMNYFVHAPIDSEIEAFGQIYVEALAAGIPSVFTLSGIANQFILHEENALIVPHAKSSTIAEALIRLHNDKAIQQKLVEKGRSSVQQFALNKFIEKTENLYV